MGRTTTALLGAVSMLALTFPAAARAEQIGEQSFTTLRELGPAALPAASGLQSVLESRNDELTIYRRSDIEGVLSETSGGDASPKVFAPLTIPSVKNNKISLVNKGFSGFDGLNHADQRLAGTGVFTNTQFSLEPPDQGLCVGNGFVVETINTALAVYGPDGSVKAGPVALNQFFGLAPEVIRSAPPVYGDFTSDPRCYYDHQTRRWFVTLLQIDVDPATGGLLGGSHLLIAVSKTADPTGGWNRFALDVTTHGASGVCPCYGDQPLLGADANGFYLSTNAFSIATNRFGGSQLYALSKLFLGAGHVPPFVLHIALGGRNSDGSFNFSVHPSTRAPGEEFSEFGTEYFLSNFDITSALENNVVAWALRGTQFLNFPPGPYTKFTFERQAVPSENYGTPPDALQRIGTLFYGSQVDPGVRPSLATNDQRMQEVTFADGKLWSSVTTVMNSPDDTVPAGAFGDPNKAGVAWFAVAVRCGKNLEASMAHQGYIALKNANLSFPAVGVTSEGKAAIGFTIVGPDIFPSTGYSELKGHKFNKVHVAAAGPGSADGFTGYPSSYPPGQAPCDFSSDPVQCEERWGDYGAAAVGPDGSIWLANEYVSPRPRTLLANWGTFVTRLARPGDDDEDDD
jgi:hypothetical protein